MCPDANHFLKPRGPQNAEDIGRQLRALPTEQPAPYDFAEFNRRSRDRSQSRRTLVKWPHAAAAAALTAFVAGMAMLASGDRSTQPEETGSQLVASTRTDSMQSSTTPRSPGDSARSDDESSATRQWLARQPQEPALVRVVPRMAVARLEDRIAWFDDAMTEERLHGANADHLRVMQQERARLMGYLAQVRYAESLSGDGS